MDEAAKQKLLDEMNSLLRGLRQCDTQATAVAWMTRAYNAMDGSLRLIAELEKSARVSASQEKGLIFQLPAQRLEVVQAIPKHIAHRATEVKRATYPHNGGLVIYPDFFIHPGLKVAPKAWTRADTLRLEAAARTPRNRIIKKGR